MIRVAESFHPSGGFSNPAVLSSRHQRAHAMANTQLIQYNCSTIGATLTLTNFDLFHLVQDIHAINDHTNNGVFA